MMLARASCVVVGLAVGLAAALWLDGIIPPVGLLAIAHVVGVVAAAVVAMLATAVCTLVVSDWQVDAQSRHDWAQLGLTPAHLMVALEPACESDIDLRYPAATSDETLQQVFRIHCATTLTAHSVSISVPSTEFPSAPLAREQGRHPATASKTQASECALRPVVGAPARVAVAVSRSWKGKRHAKKTTQPLRLVANGDAWPEWQARIFPQAGKAADVIVLSAERADRAQPPPEASTLSDDAESIAQPACRGPPRTIARRLGARETTVEQQRNGHANSSSRNVVVRDDFGSQIPISAGELEVIEIYLGHVLHGLLASSTTKSDSDKS